MKQGFTLIATFLIEMGLESRDCRKEMEFLITLRELRDIEELFRDALRV